MAAFPRHMPGTPRMRHARQDSNPRPAGLAAWQVVEMPELGLAANRYIQYLPPDLPGSVFVEAFVGGC
jgi:hypothetical protein